MVAYKHITKIISVIVAAAVLVCMLALMFPERVTETFGGGGVAIQYETELFDTSRIIEIDIQMDEEQWADMLAHAAEEEYYSCDVVINQETIYNVGIRPKGNTSLSSIVMDPDTDRFSFKMEFDRYVDGQTCFGLDKLVLNNNYADATNMKEALVYDMYRYLDVDASLYNYARISVNGEYWGVYLALEAVEDSFQLRNYGTAKGNLYKPESMGMEGGRGGEGGGPGRSGMPPGDMRDEWGDGEQINMVKGEEKPQPEEEAEGRTDAGAKNGKAGWPDREGMPGRGPFMGGSGADLNYTDDDLDSYSTIWEGEVNNTGKKDHRRVVTALKNLSEGNDLERYMDVDNILKYMAVHVFSVNLDSLSGTMAHNYYLYEENGQLNILPWDYNLSFGGMGMGRNSGASGTVNDAIDTPFDATEFFDGLLEDERYLARYHEYLRQLAETYVFGGRFEEFCNRVHSQIDELTETDPTAFYSPEEYEAASAMLYDTVLLRAESILGQLVGAIPSTDEGQKADSSHLIDASSIDIEIMGTMGGNRNFGRDGEAGQKGGRERAGDSQRTEAEPGGEGQQADVMPGGEGQQAEAMPGGEGQQAEAMPGGEGQQAEAMPGGEGQQADVMPGGKNRQTEADPAREAFNEGPAMPGGPGGGSMEVVMKNLAVCGICLFLSAAALVLAMHYRRIPKRFTGE